MRGAGKTAALALATALLAVAGLEAALHLAAALVPRVDRTLTAYLSAEPRVLPDAHLGHRPNPAFPGHDARGFRNPRVPERADVVALGDSQTYGVGVADAEAWPRRLESVSGRSVYSLACGGYGPVHGLLLWEEAARLRPEVVIQTLYAGNDLYDAFTLVYERRALPQLAAPGLAARLRARDAQPGAPPAWGGLGTPWAVEPPEPEEGLSTRRLLARYSRLHGLVRGVEHQVRRLRDRLRLGPDAAWLEALRESRGPPFHAHVLDDGRHRTLLTSRYRLAALELGDPRVAEGRRLALEALRRLDVRTREAGARLLVVLIPTKERVFEHAVSDPPGDFRRLMESEAHLWLKSVAFLEQHGIGYVDTLPALREALSRGPQPYPETHDGHPNAAGHEAIARVVAGRLPARGAGSPGAVQESALRVGGVRTR